jgi:hypothetical protein
MSGKRSETDSPAASLKNESARQRWELFHQAIARAKETNTAAMDDAEVSSGDADVGGPMLSIVR